MNTELDLIPVSSLSDRYGVARSNIYNRLSGLDIEPEKQGGKAYINADQLKQMDSLDQHLKAGGTIADFQTEGQLSYGPTGQAEKSYRTQDNLPSLPFTSKGDQSLALTLVVDAIAGKLIDLKPVDPLANLELLEKACSHRWLLSTSQLAPLLGLKSLTSKEFHRYGFTFTKVGRNGAESAWAIAKTSGNS
ncbi:hypothetical protein K9N68_05850 [Kovacikia minuta CCNUW1]|uniref:hypothetical protein n=1 Tax=Kovacikia minuta TaxID=2931930 RepID=UPI001CCFBC51|nr:hypothetical protein [Kovacikia minuta]UBF27468.1 hypothetical protein K9N68_05850 [Kovacikia minuta CCNUW1]